MENIQVKARIQNKDEDINSYLKYENSYDLLTLLFNEFKLHNIINYNNNNDLKAVSKLTIINHDDSMLEIKTRDNNTSTFTPPAKTKNNLTNSRDVLYEIIILLMHIKYLQHSNYYEDQFFSPLLKKKNSLQAILQYFRTNWDNYYTHNQKVLYNCYLIDLNQRLKLLEGTSKILNCILLNTRPNYEALPDVNSSTIVIDLEKLEKHIFFYIHENSKIKYEEYIIEPSKSVEIQKPVIPLHFKDLKFLPKTNSPNSLNRKDLSVQFRKTTSKYHLSSINCFKALATIFCLLSNNLSPTLEPKTALSLCIKSWYIRNIALGYLLHNLFNYFNINSLFILKNVTFVIITIATPNLCFKMYFKFQNGIFMIYDRNPYSCFTKPNYWKINISISRKLCSLDTPILSLMSQKILQVQLPTSPYWNSMTSYIKSQHTSNNDISLTFGVSDSMTHSSYLGSESCISLQTKSSYISNCDKGSVETFILPIIELTEQFKVLNVESPKSDQIFNKKNSMYDLPLFNRGACLTKLYKQSEEIKSTLNILLVKFDCINETIFERLTPSEYGDVANKFWEHMSSPTPYKVFLKCLGHSLLDIFFGARI